MEEEREGKEGHISKEARESATGQWMAECNQTMEGGKQEINGGKKRMMVAIGMVNSGVANNTVRLGMVAIGVTKHRRHRHRIHLHRRRHQRGLSTHRLKHCRQQ